MKNIKLLFVVVFFGMLSCSSDDSSRANDVKGDGQGGSLAIFALAGNYLYTVDNQNLNVFSLLDEGQPVSVNNVPIGRDIETLFAHGQRLFVGSRNGMFIYSIENPENPILLSSVQHFTACDPVVANETNSFVTLHSNNVCGNNMNALMVYDTSNPYAPQLIHTRNLVAPKGLGLYGNYLFVCDDVIKVFDISIPENPTLAKSIDVSAFDVIIRGNEMYAIGENTLRRYQLDPSNIQNISPQSQINF